MTMRFADHFSAGASDYAAFRPRYPDALFEWLAARSPGRALAWDCATGSGQAATGLSGHFDQVVGTDASDAQVREADARANIVYRQAPAEQSGLASASADLVTVAQALHWLPLDAFYAEARRVLRPGGLLAAWGYALPSVAGDVDPLVRRLHGEVVGPYWPPGREMVDEHYRSVPFPFAEVEVPRFAMAQQLDRNRFVGYLRTWSAVRRFVEAQRMDPLAFLIPRLEAAWPEGEVRTVEWPLFARAGYREQSVPVPRAS